MPPEKIKIEERLVKHEFSTAEKVEKGSELARALGNKSQVEAEFEGVKSTYKARIAECDSRAEKVSNDIRNGFEMRTKRCKVEFRTKDRKKDFYPEIKDGVFEVKPALTEDMTQDDFQTELFEAESRFERRSEVSLFKGGVLVLGRLKDKWYAALRVKVGEQAIEERLAPDGKKWKARSAALMETITRLRGWVVDQFGEETWKGFQDSVDKAVKVQEPLEE